MTAMTSSAKTLAGWSWIVALATLVLAAAMGTGAMAQDTGSQGVEAPSAAELRYMNRPIVTLRARIGAVTPAERAARARTKLTDLEFALLGEPIEVQPVTLGDQSGVAFMLAGRLLFGLGHDDLDPEQDESFEDLVAQTKANLEAAFAAQRAQRSLPVLLRGIGVSFVATFALALLCWVVWRLRTRLRGLFDRLLERQIQKSVKAHLDWGRYGLAVTARLVQVLLFFVFITLGYAWLTFVLAQFPLTEPLGDRLGTFLLELLLNLGREAAAAVPGLTTAVIILLFAQALSRASDLVVEAAESGSISLAFLHRDTARASRRIFRIVIWAAAIAIAYPYIPGSESAAFQGLSVLFGIMITLGSTGAVSQFMSGMVLTYARALRPGEYVRVGETEGTVTELGALSTKIATFRNEEITIPNSVLIENSITNYSRLASGKGVLASTSVTIGYDTPWRQVHAMLLLAAEQTANIRSDPRPFVVQRALSDFYVAYDLMVYMDNPLDRPLIFSALHTKIQDTFNEYGVQIMSPQYYDQPPVPLVVPKEKWHMPPAKPD